ncbi:MAG TPA: hypothetical protein VM784_00860 [Actinomycetota bacterium]|nr:hypothetical protein [Actinomycetota bacterium]
MSSACPRGRSFWIFGLASGGIAAGHSLAFFLAPPGGNDHGSVTSSGHGHWEALAAVCIFAALAGLLTFAIRWAHAPSAGREARSLFAPLALRLGLLQAGGFIVLETVERLLARGHAHALPLWEEPVMWLGLALQAVVAVAGALLLLILARTVEAVRSRARRPSAATSRVSSWPEPAVPLTSPRVTMASGGPSFRGPPATRR